MWGGTGDQGSLKRLNVSLSLCQCSGFTQFKSFCLLAVALLAVKLVFSLLLYYFLV